MLDLHTREWQATQPNVERAECCGTKLQRHFLASNASAPQPNNKVGRNAFNYGEPKDIELHDYHSIATMCENSNICIQLDQYSKRVREQTHFYRQFCSDLRSSRSKHTESQPRPL